MRRRIRWLAAALCAVLLPLPALGAAPATGGPEGTEVLFSLPGEVSGLARTDEGGWLAADGRNKVVWCVGEEPQVCWGEPAGEGVSGGYRDGERESALFADPWAIVPYLDGWAVSDSANNSVRYLADGQVHTLSARRGSAFELENPTGLAVDGQGNLYVADTNHDRIVKLDSSGRASVWAQGFSEPTGLCWQGNTLYVADSGNHRICAVRSGESTVLAGGEEGFRDGAASSAQFSTPQGLAVGEDGAVYIADTGNGAVRRLQDGLVTTLVQGGRELLWPVSPRAMVLTGDSLAVADQFTGVVFSLELAAPSFPDVKGDAWYANAVGRAAGLGLMGGYGGGFHPQEPMTRAMAVQLLFNLERVNNRALLVSGSAPFADGDAERWYAPVVGWAWEQGLVKGKGGGVFCPEEAISRQEMVTLLHRLLGAEQPKSQTLDFPDAGDAAGWARPALCWAVEQGVLTGRSGRLAPTERITRAEAAALLVRLLER